MGHTAVSTIKVSSVIHESYRRPVEIFSGRPHHSLGHENLWHRESGGDICRFSRHTRQAKCNYQMRHVLHISQISFVQRPTRNYRMKLLISVVVDGLLPNSSAIVINRNLKHLRKFGKLHVWQRIKIKTGPIRAVTT